MSQEAEGFVGPPGPGAVLTRELTDKTGKTLTFRRNESGSYSYKRGRRWKDVRDPGQIEWVANLFPPMPEREGASAQFAKGTFEGLTFGIDPLVEGLESGYESLGGVVAQNPPQGVGETAARWGGEVMGMVPPTVAAFGTATGKAPWMPAAYLAALKNAPRAVKWGTTLLDEMARPFVSASGAGVKPLVVEGITGATGGAAHDLSGGDPTATLIGSGIGGWGATTIPSRIAMAIPPAISTGLRKGVPLVRQLWTKSGRQKLRADATGTLTDYIDNPEGMVQQTLDDPLSPIAPATRGGELRGETLSGQRAIGSIASRTTANQRQELVEALEDNPISQYTTLAQQSGNPDLIAQHEAILLTGTPEQIAQYRQNIRNAKNELADAVMGRQPAPQLEPNVRAETLGESVGGVRQRRDITQEGITELATPQEQGILTRKASRDLGQVEGTRPDVGTAAEQTGADLVATREAATKRIGELWDQIPNETLIPARGIGSDDGLFDTWDAFIKAKVKASPMGKLHLPEIVDRQLKWINGIKTGALKRLKAGKEELLPQDLLDRGFEAEVIQGDGNTQDILIHLPGGEVYAMYSTLREGARFAATRQQNTRRKFLNELADATLNFTKTIPEYTVARQETHRAKTLLEGDPSLQRLWQPSGGTQGGLAQVEANPTQIFEDLNLDQGTQGAANRVRKLLDATSTEPLPPDQAQAYYDALQGARGDVATAQVQRQFIAARDNRQTVDALNDYYRDGFAEAAMGTEQEALHNTKKAQQFINKHSALWDANRFPEFADLKRDLDRMVQVSARYNAVANIRPRVQKYMNSADGVAELKIARSQGDLRDAQPRLIQSAMFDELVRANNGDFYPDAGKKLVDALKEGTTSRGMLEQVFSTGELKRLEAIASEWRNVEMALNPEAQKAARAGVPAIDGGVIGGDNLLSGVVNWLGTSAQLGGSQIGIPGFRQTAGPSLQQAQIMAQKAKRATSKLLDVAVLDLLEEAYRDPRLFKQLLQSTDKLDAGAIKRIFGMGWGFAKNIMRNRMARMGTLPLGATLGQIVGERSQEEMAREAEETQQWFRDNPPSLIPPLQVPPPGAPRE